MTENWDKASKTKVVGMNETVSNYKFNVLIFITMVMLLFALMASTARAQEDNRPIMKISLKEAISLALQKNYDIQIGALSTENAYANLLGSFAVYDLGLSSDFSFSKRNQRQVSTFAASSYDSQGFNMSLSRKISTGGDARLTFSTDRSASNSATTTLNPQFGDSLTANLTQPFLKNFGKFATEQRIIINRNNMKISESDFERQVVTTMVNVLNRYLDLVSAYDALGVAQDSLELANQQLEINKVKVRVGTLPEIEIVQAELQVAEMESSLIDAEIEIRRAEDNLKTAIVMEDLETRLQPTDVARNPEGEKYSYDSAYSEALDNRPEIRRLQLTLENNETGIKYSRNQLKPELNLEASFNLYSDGGTFTPGLFGQAPPDGLPLSYLETFTDVFSAENRNWSVGAVFRYTFGNSGAKANLLGNEIAKKQNALQLEQLRFSVAVEVRNAIRELEASTSQLAARRKALDYAERQYDAEKQKFDVGTSTNFQVLEFQNRLFQARNRIIIAQIRYNKALIEYGRATGALLQDNAVQINTTQKGVAGATMGK